MNKFIKLLIGSTAVLSISSCGLLGPSYKKPEVTTLDAFRSNTSGIQVESGVNLTDVSWWTKFNDQNLDKLIDLALANNNNIQMAIANIKVAQLQLKQIHFQWIPTLNLGGTAAAGQLFNSNNGIQNPIETQIAPNQPYSNFNFYSAGLIPSYGFNVFSLIKGADLAKANIDVQQDTKDTVRLTVISQVVGSYFTLLALNKQIIQQQKLIDDLTAVVEFAKIEHKHGYAALSDISQYQEQLQQAKIGLPSLTSDKVAAQNALRVMVNKDPGEVVTDIDLDNISTDGIIPSSLPSQVLKNRPDIKQAEAQLRLANANIGVATANFFPTIDITTPLGLYNANFSNLFTPSSDFWSTQITAVMPILNAGLLVLVKQRKAEYYVAYYNYIQTVRNAFANVDNSFANYNGNSETLKYTKQFYAINKIDYDLTTKKFKLGYIAYSDTFTSKLNLDKALIATTQAKLQQLQALVLLYQALAGGYNYNNTNKLPFETKESQS
ncbi:MAG: efflux transporter outer membrane subunit [Burkholderiales bacterium]|nr:efflux transporter outer membrane subunit [Burkholderiales bacterium]